MSEYYASIPLLEWLLIPWLLILLACLTCRLDVACWSIPEQLTLAGHLPLVFEVASWRVAVVRVPRARVRMRALNILLSVEDDCCCLRGSGYLL